MGDEIWGVELKNAEAVSKALAEVEEELSGGPMMQQALKTSTLMITATAKQLAPVDTGHLRASITPTVQVGMGQILGIVGSNVEYAPYMELGTRAHWPPLAALETWAKRHGTTAWVVARAIATKGIAPRKYLQKAFEQNLQQIAYLLSTTIRVIIKKYT